MNNFCILQSIIAKLLVNVQVFIYSENYISVITVCQSKFPTKFSSFSWTTLRRIVNHDTLDWIQQIAQICCLFDLLA